MDDLDRLAFRLVRTVRNSYPHLLEQEFTLTDLEERLLPFRDARREMSDTGPEAWEINVLRMVSGEREYLRTDADLQLACRQALTLPSPTLALVRPWSATTLRLGASAGNIGGERLSPPSNDPFASTALGLEFSNDSLRLATPSISTTAEHRAPSGALRTASNGAAQRFSSQDTLSPYLSSLGNDAARSGAARVSSSHGAQSPAASHDARSQSGSAHSVSASGATDIAREGRATPQNALRNCGCRFCGGRLPDGRKFTFCPHCGINLTVRQCPACSTELDVNWRFCVTCGRGSDVPDLPVSTPKVAGSIPGG